MLLMDLKFINKTHTLYKIYMQNMERNIQQMSSNKGRVSE